MLGGRRRQNRRVKWFAESWLLGRTMPASSPVGARLLRERYSTDLGLVVPLGPYGFVMPMINLTWSF